MIHKIESKNRRRCATCLAEITNFGEELARCKDILEPLAVAPGVLQSDSSSLSSIFVTFGKLYTSYSALQERAMRLAED